MQVKPQDIISLGALVLTTLIAMKVKRKVLRWVLVSIGIICVVAMFFWPGDKTNASDNHTQTTIANSTGATISQNSGNPTFNINGGINQIGGTGNTLNVTQSVEQIPHDTKKELRAFLAAVNPQIIEMIDEGKAAIPVMLGVLSQIKLQEFSTRQDFKEFLSYTSTGNTIDGGDSNHIGGYMNEMNQSGSMNSFVLYPTVALKK
jgi:hypothetical protein